MDKFLADQEQRVQEEIIKRAQEEIRRLAEIRRKQLGRIEFTSAGTTRKR